MASSTPTPSTPLTDSEAPLNQRNNCFYAFKRLSKSAWRRFSGPSRESRAHTPSICEPPIETLIVDEEAENTPPLENEQFESGPLEVDPNESCEFTFENTHPAYLVNTSSSDRMSALCAKYGLPHDADALRPTPYVNAPSGRLRVPKRTRQRVRVECHFCNSIFKGEKWCLKCGHRRCGECKRQPVTEPPSSIEKPSFIVVDDGNVSSDDDRMSSLSFQGIDARPMSAIVPEVDGTSTELPRPTIERSKHICHKCSEDFSTITNSVCEKCGHEKCSRCSRQVLHISYPYYDASEGMIDRTRQQRVYRPSRQRVRHYCDQCRQMFAPGTKICGECLHKRCQNCSRLPIKRRRIETAPNPDPAVLQAVEARTAKVSLPTASKTGAQASVQ